VEGDPIQPVPEFFDSETLLYTLVCFSGYELRTGHLRNGRLAGASGGSSFDKVAVDRTNYQLR
jgi:hypothetical protein